MTSTHQCPRNMDSAYPPPPPNLTIRLWTSRGRPSPHISSSFSVILPRGNSSVCRRHGPSMTFSSSSCATLPPNQRSPSHSVALCSRRPRAADYAQWHRLEHQHGLTSLGP